MLAKFVQNRLRILLVLDPHNDDNAQSAINLLKPTLFGLGTRHHNRYNIDLITVFNFLYTYYM